MSYKCISVQKANELIENNNAQMIDIRDPDSYNAGHITNSEHVDNNNVNEFIKQADFERPLIICCYHGHMSQSAAVYFGDNGFKKTYSIDGGYEAWKQLYVK